MMKVFLSYAHEQRPIAEEIHAALLVRDFEVFFDKSTLKAGRSFDVAIQRSIKTCDLFIFLISPQALDKRSYTINELEYAKEKWKNPSGRILPVMARPTLYSRIDPYLRAVNILSTQGNLPAAVASSTVALLRNEGPEPMDLPPTLELLRERIAAYKGLWELTDVLPKWPRSKDVTYKSLLDLSRSLQKWYFGDGCGMFLSRTARQAYGTLQDSLTAILMEKRSGAVTNEHYDSIRELCSSVRSSLARDVGSRE